MGYNKNFVVKNGLEVATNLIVADPTTLSVGIGTTVPRYTLHTLGGIGATFATITGVGTIGNIVLSGGVSAGSSQGVAGQYLVRTGDGVTWQSFPTTRTTSTQTATAAQTFFSFAYTVGLLDVYVNGVKLTAAEFVATDGASVTITQPCFGGETVEFIAYSTVSAGVGYTGINGITVQNSGITTGNGLSITSINFTGAGVAVAGSGVGVTVTIAGAGGSGTNYWSKTAAGINTLSNVGIGTTNPTNKFSVIGDANIVGVLTVGSLTSGFNPGQIDVIQTGSGSVRLYPGYIQFNGNGNIQQIADQQYFRAGQSGASSYLFSNYYGGFDHELFFIDTNGGIRVAGNANIAGFTTTARLNVGTGGTVITTTATSLVGIGTTNPTEVLHVGGNARVGINTSQGVILTSPDGTKYRLFVENGGTLKTIAV